MAAEAAGDEDAAVRTLKLVLIGDGSSGKTSIANQYTQASFGKSYNQTIGLDFYQKRVEFSGEKLVTLNIWDIGGQSLAGKMIDTYLENADGVLLVYDLTNLNSFENLDDWLVRVRKLFKGKPNFPKLALVANKSDLSHMRAVSPAKHQAFVKENDCLEFTVAAKSGDQLAFMFKRVAGEITGYKLTKAELQQEQLIVPATIVDHPNAPPQPAPPTKLKSSFCALQ
eukprot:m.37220 g.37220  ORF g.37220 m.37220 type:complete len:226 (+) comp11084_c0_seq3:308-985(+)